ncbi:MAG TPA: SPFH domain-containing protein [Bryobacteraceae bacterium]|nr:SPFH domain-containing protein [Bryobacteraceae bacterium]
MQRNVRHRVLQIQSHRLHPPFLRRQTGPRRRGLSFFYFGPASSIVSIPLGSVNIPFAFQEPTADFQALTVQGQMTYRIADPKKAASMLDFTVDSNGHYRSDQYQKLPERLVYHLQTLVRAGIQGLALREALVHGDALTGLVLGQLKASPEVTQIGVEILNLAILALRPTPEMAKALEAEAREALNRNADEAVYTRRNAAIEQERRLKENELQTELAVQNKQRELHEREMEAQIALETQRAALTDQKSENERKEADSRAYALQAIIAPVQGLDWRVLMMLNPQGGDARNTIAMAFQDLAANAQKIGELNVSPDLLRTLIAAPRG